MKKCLFYSCFMLLMSHSAIAQFAHNGRGMYVDKFFRTATDLSGNTIVDQNLSILSIASKENALLSYAKENHITYLILYDLHRVFGNALYENYLCSFLQKAKTLYCIEYIGVASSCASMFDNLSDSIGTPPIAFAAPEFVNEYTSPGVLDQLAFVEDHYQPGDSLFYLSEFTKLNIRTAEFNQTCAYKFDLMVTEYEFWNTGVDNCTGASQTKDQKFQNFQAMINYMDIIRENYNATHTTHQLYVEAYLGFLNQNTIYTHQTIANWIDGSVNGKRRVDRINLHYYGDDATKLYSRTNAGQNFSGYYDTRFKDFCQSTTNVKTNMLPIMSAEYIPWGFGSNYLGSWFNKSVNNTIFTAEKIWYNDWYSDANTYNPSTVGDPNFGNAIAPGGALWFTSSQMNGHLNNPVLFTSNSPVCVSTGQSGTFSFNYQGPIERGSTFKFYLTDTASATLRCGSTTAISWPAYNGITQTSIDLNAALGSCSLPLGEYDAHLELTYASSCSTCLNACSVYVAPPVRVSVVNSGKIVALTGTVVCQGNPVYLKASTATSGTNTYQWYNGASTISGATAINYAPDASSTGTKNISCKITSSVGTCSANLSNVIPITINAFPTASITVQNPNLCPVVLKANPSGLQYNWSDGSSSSTYSTNKSGTYSVNVSSNNCTSTASYSLKKTNIEFISSTITCPGDSSGTITVNLYWGIPPYSISWTGPVNGIMNGLTHGYSTIVNLPEGTYAITVTDVDGCSEILSSVPVISEVLSIYHMTGGGSYCGIAPTPLSIGLDGSQSGVTYYLFLDGVLLPSFSILGNENAITFGNHLNPGTYTVHAVSNNNCSVFMSDSAIISVQQATSWYLDADMDGYGDGSLELIDCSQPLGYIELAGDCNDSDSLVHPGAFELCNGVDDNCNGQTDENTCNISFQLNIFIQAYFNDSIMNPALFNSGISIFPNDCDTVVISLIDADSLLERETKMTILKTNGEAMVNFDSISVGKNYYLRVRHRSALETWSAVPVLIQSNNQYNFTLSDSAAYGKNQTEVAPGLWAFWSGDISSTTNLIKDGIVDESDLNDLENAIHLFKNGYQPEDINGDGIVESSDFSLLESNITFILRLRRP